MELVGDCGFGYAAKVACQYITLEWERLTHPFRGKRGQPGASLIGAKPAGLSLGWCEAGGAELNSPSSPPATHYLDRSLTPLLQGARVRGQGDQRNMRVRYFVLWGMEWERSRLCGVGAWVSTYSPTWPCWIWARAGQHRLQLGVANMPVPPTLEGWLEPHPLWVQLRMPANLGDFSEPLPGLEEMLTKIDRLARLSL